MSAPERFLPGTIVASRYRIVAPLGRGGMGEVFRADDLELEQTVALKFLPAELASSDEHLARFKGEVRVARQVSHPNICRVHDVGEVDGQYFISMEYVDGEDLATLLRRIGRLPEDKALEISQQICAGLDAAHDRGILHRDLKPANIMIDGQGGVRIADFGLAAVAADLQREDVRVGTPAYMAPEQLAGKEVTKQSDIYSLGLVLFELFTGRPAFEAKTLDELLRQREQTKPTASTVLAGIDPTVDAAIQRCLAGKPEERPQSAREVALALPGADPLAAALAAGETPSPELVAAAGGTGLVSRARGLVLAAIVVVCLIASGFFDREMQLLERVDPELPTAVMVHRARKIAERLTLLRRPHVDHAYGWLLRTPAVFFQDIAEERWARLEEPAAGAARFWYRSSPGLLRPMGSGERVRFRDPPLDTTGMFNLMLRSDGTLESVIAKPGNRDESRALDWSLAFEEAGLDIASFEELPGGGWAPEHACSERRRWTGPHPKLAGVRIEIKGAALGDALVHFSQSLTWTIPDAVPHPRSELALGALFDISVVAVLALVLIGGVWFGYRNIKLGRGDTRSATRIAIYLFALSMVRWLLEADHVPHASAELMMAIRAISNSLFTCTLAWFLYVAIEPTVRRIWPQKLVSWTRMLDGRLRDPLVSRDVLAGLAAGLIMITLIKTHWTLVPFLGGTEPGPFRGDVDGLLGPSYIIGDLLWEQQDAGLTALLATFLLVFFQVLVRNLGVATCIVFLLALVRMPPSVTSDLPVLDLGVRGLQVALFLLVIFRAGLLSLFVMLFTLSTVGEVAITLDFSKWYSGQSIVVLTVVAGLTAFTYWTATTPRPVERPR